LKKYLNREISWLAFNGRVLQEAADKSVPLINRLRFLGIFSNNRDEFFSVRVATVRRMQIVGSDGKAALGRNPKKLLAEILAKVKKQEKEFLKIYSEIVKEMEDKNVFIVNEKKLTDTQIQYLKNYFHQKIHNALVPIMIDDERPLPELKDKSIYLALKLTPKAKEEKTLYSLIKVPTETLPRFIPIPNKDGKKYLILLEDVIRLFVKDIFFVFDCKQIEAYIVKITRDAELDIEDDKFVTLIEKISKSVEQRKLGEPVRLVYDSSIPKDLRNVLINKLGLQEDSLVPGGRYHSFKDFIDFPDVGPAKWTYRTLPQIRHKDLPINKSVLSQIAKKDILLTYPYHSFNHFIDMLREAAIDPKVTTIKMTIYRLAKNSKVIANLINAAKNGKEVLVLMEIQARFDEQANIEWAKEMQDAGVNVIFGFPSIKVHSKVCLVTRIEDGKKVRYCNIATGNFNEVTANIFSDFTLLTANEKITSEMNRLFTFFRKSYKNYKYQNIIVAPFTCRTRLYKLINNEMENATAGNKAEIILKMNSLVDKKMIKKLYAASQAGVKVKLIVRGICCLTPGVKGLSENIEAISIIDKFLEHARVFVFHNNGDPAYYIGSADLMPRNLDNRIETICPIYDQDIKDELKKFLTIQWADNSKARLHDYDLKNEYRSSKSKKKQRAQIDYYNYLKSKHLSS